MSWVTLALSAAFSWRLYGASLHRGQTELGNPLRAMLCVGVAYFLIAVLVPVAALTSQGEWRNFTVSGTLTATLAGAIGAGHPDGVQVARDVHHAASNAVDALHIDARREGEEIVLGVEVA